MKRIRIALGCAIATVFSLAPLLLARDVPGKLRTESVAAAVQPAYCVTAHSIGRIALSVANNGTIGDTYRQYDCFTGLPLPSCIYPKGSHTQYLWGASLWIGAIVGQDTLVSTGFDGWSVPGAEFHPDADLLTSMVYRSTIARDPFFHAGAVSEQDFVATYYDTCLTCLGVSSDPVDLRPHRPIGLQIVQRTHAWSHQIAEDFVLFEYTIRNLNQYELSNVHVGIFVDADVLDVRDIYGNGYRDDVTGYLRGACPPHSVTSCPLEDSISVAWIADNDGDLHQNILEPVSHVTGVSILQSPAVGSRQSYNWWIPSLSAQYDYGPQARSTYRLLVSGGSGLPKGDREKFHYLSNGEIDYDQVRMAVIPVNDPVWVPHSTVLNGFVLGADARFLLSVGPFSIPSGGTAPFVFAYLMGENLHKDSTNFYNLPNNPGAYLANLDFSDLLVNAAAARRIFDNPGVDTDSDGYAGEYNICAGDTVWYRGDGVPDWQVSVAPSAPPFRTEPQPGAVRVRWNGFATETAIDPVSRDVGFEGYRVYLSLSGEPGSYNCIGWYDIEDFFCYRWNSRASDWQLARQRLTLETARCQYAPAGCADSVWHPVDYPRSAPYVLPTCGDSVFYFVPVMANASRLGFETPFVKPYSSAPCPAYRYPDEVPEDSVDIYLTDAGAFKYYEYEFVITGLIPGQPYWIAVTAFDCGSPASGAPSTESDMLSQARIVVPFDPDCCHGPVGNVDCDDSDQVSISDIVVLIDFLFISRKPPCCLAEADINQSGGPLTGLEDITVGDVALLVSHLYIEVTDLPDCLNR